VKIETVEVGALDPERFREVLPPDRFAVFEDVIARSRDVFEGRVVWNVNSTAHGGGVAEMLRSLLAYARGAGIDARWLVIPGTPEFFRVTKRLHNLLHGYPGDGGVLDEEAARTYAETLAPTAEEIARLTGPGDVILVHDPQPAGLVPPLREGGAIVVWRGHIGIDMPNDLTRAAWDFLRPHVEPADAYVFSRKEYVWDGLDPSKVAIIPPSIDAFSPKNQDLPDGAVNAICAVAGLVANDAHGDPVFVREDTSTGQVERAATFADGGEPPPADARLVVQVSRWDGLKDPVGVVEGFATTAASHEAHLIVAGPSVEGVADDPEGAQVLDETRAAWEQLEPAVRARVHLANLPMEDGAENAAIVNALQRRATVVVQKSLAEGFGLTVTEAMWKARPVVAGGVGGIRDQIEDGVSGVLLDDPKDLSAYGEAIASLLAAPERAERMGEAARARARDRFLGPRHLVQYFRLFEGLLVERRS
jgi:trehalose synthase